MANWIKNAITKPSFKAPTSRVDAARHSKNGLLKKRAILAATKGKTNRRGPKRTATY